MRYLGVFAALKGRVRRVLGRKFSARSQSRHSVGYREAVLRIDAFCLVWGNAMWILFNRHEFLLGPMIPAVFF